MRISWYIYVPIMLTAVCLTWYLRTKDMNFMPDTSVDTTEEQVQESYELEGPPAPLKVDQSAFDPGTALLGLDHFSNYGDNPEELLRLFAILRSRDDADLSYLAGERVMEHPQISDEEKRIQAAALRTVADAVEPYIFDATEVRPLSITLAGIPEGLSTAIASELDELVYLSSGGLVEVTMTSAEGSPSLSLTASGAVSSTPLSEQADLKEIVSGLYILLATEMNKQGFQIPVWDKATPAEFYVALTRLAWEDLPLAAESEPEESALEAEGESEE